MTPSIEQHFYGGPWLICVSTLVRFSTVIEVLNFYVLNLHHYSHECTGKRKDLSTSALHLEVLNMFSLIIVYTALTLSCDCQWRERQDHMCGNQDTSVQTLLLLTPILRTPVCVLTYILKYFRAPSS